MVAKGKIAKVTWEDAAHYRDERPVGWYKENASTCIFETVGHVIRSNRSNIVLAHETNEENTARDVSIIPKGMIREIKYLEEK